MTNAEKKEIMQALGAVSRKVNDIAFRINNHYTDMHEKNADNIETNSGGLDEIAEMVESQNQALNDLAEVISELMEG